MSVAIVPRMNDGTSLVDYLKRPGKTQSGLAASAGVTQGAIHQMMKSGRSIFVREHDDGRVDLYEIKPIGRRSESAA